jgi:hypothetical protein
VTKAVKADGKSTVTLKAGAGPDSAGVDKPEAKPTLCIYAEYYIIV